VVIEVVITEPEKQKALALHAKAKGVFGRSLQ